MWAVLVPIVFFLGFLLFLYATLFWECDLGSDDLE